ncbi:MAG: HAD hydrolase-like protein [Proteobacteria bacterium]|nr:HAD hydrolase-like protein [Pseudomonadota bacterium]MBU1650307.1 HAD hydrolase-like protein [Pseudomonadota bacterium]
MNNTTQIQPDFSWGQIDTVLLDMDGTLLDKYFDDFFWEEYVPKIFGEQNQMSSEQARKELLKRYQRVESTLQWTDLDYWSEQLQLDIPELKCKVDHLIQVHPFVIDFLQFIRKIGKKVHLVTNAHSKTLEIKMRKTALGGWFDRIVCAEEVGEAKEQPAFWDKLEGMLNYDRKRTLLADDTAKVLRSARVYEMGFLIFVARPSSRLPIRYSEEFPSIVTFDELIF